MLNHMGAAYNAAAASSPLEGAGPQSSRRHCLIVLVFALAALALSACGGSGSTNPPASRPSTTTGSPSTPTSKPSVALPSTTTRPIYGGSDDDGPAHIDPHHGGSDDDGPAHPTTPIAETSTSSTPWGWIVVGLLLVVGLVVALVLWLRSRSRRAALTAWRHSAGPASQQAVVARDLLSGDRTNADPERREAVRSQVETAAQALDGLVTGAPDDISRRAAASAAAALRGLMFADEADRLLHSREQSPTADELAQADETQRSRARELDVALAALG